MTKYVEQELHLYLTLHESSLILEALIECPFKLVFELIGRLNHQAQQFYVPNRAENEKVLFLLEAKDIAFCIKALGDLPFSRVNGLLSNIQTQMHAQQVPSMENVNGGL